MEPHYLRLFVARSENFGFLIEDGNVINAYDHAATEGQTIFLIVNDVFQAWNTTRLGVDLALGSCVPLLKAMQGHPEADNWWATHSNAQCAIPLDPIPTSTEPTIYRRSGTSCSGPNIMLHQVDGILCAAVASSDSDSALDGIVSKVTFVRSKMHTALFYATDIEQCVHYIRVHAGSYIASCLVKLGWEDDSMDNSLIVPITPVVINTLLVSPTPINPTVALVLAKKFGFTYRTLIVESTLISIVYSVHKTTVQDYRSKSEGGQICYKPKL
jgi:hypothetical protein